MMDAAKDAAMSIEESLEEVIASGRWRPWASPLGIGFLIGATWRPLTAGVWLAMIASGFDPAGGRCAAVILASIILNGRPYVSAHDR